LVYSRGFGYDDLASKQPVSPDSLFRIASISKPFTAVTILRLTEEGKLDLDAKAFKILDIQPAGKVLDQRIWNITIRELLEHSGGWVRGGLLDPMLYSGTASCETIISFMMTLYPDFNPGTRYTYSNFGYCVLGRIIEKVAGVGYEDYVRTQVLAPMGIVDMQSGHTQLAFRAPNEVHYYDVDNRSVQSVFRNITEPVPYPYRGVYMEALDSVGGWIASAQDLVRFAVSIDGARPPAYLRPQTVEVMLARNSVLWPNEGYWYALGWEVTYPNWWHYGGIPGSGGLLVRMPNGIAWAALFNKCCHERDPIFSDLDQSLRKAFDLTKSWPSWDLFPAETRASSTTSSTMTKSAMTNSTPSPSVILTQMQSIWKALEPNTLIIAIAVAWLHLLPCATGVRIPK
jgi:N-acyl-D-amino-acid deacylase